MLPEFFAKTINEVATPVGTFNLPVTKRIDRGKQFLSKYFKCHSIVVAPVIAIGKLEAIDVPICRWKSTCNQLRTNLVGGTNPCAAALARVIKGMFVDLLGNRVVNNVTLFDPLILVR